MTLVPIPSVVVLVDPQTTHLNLDRESGCKLLSSALDCPHRCLHCHRGRYPVDENRCRRRSVVDHYRENCSFIYIQRCIPFHSSICRDSRRLLDRLSVRRSRAVSRQSVTSRWDSSHLQSGGQPMGKRWKPEAYAEHGAYLSTVAADLPSAVLNS